MTATDASGRTTLRLVRASTLTGMPVVTLGGDRALEVKDVVFDKTVGGITGFTLRKPGLLGGPQKRVLPIAGVLAVGGDAVMISSHDAFAAEDVLADVGDDVLGDRVVTDDGTELGTVVDVVASIQGGDGDIVGFEIEGSAALGDEGQHVYLPLPQAIAISGEAIVVPAAARDHASADFSAFGGAVDAYRKTLEA
jgi:sporulation protein YlmC with PRC-barrel domain